MELESIYELMEKFKSSGLAKLELRKADTLIRMEMPRRSESAQLHPAQMPQSGDAADQNETDVEKTAAAPEGHFIRSPIVGTFYAAPEEGAAPFVRAGDKVKKGDVVCIIEAMKMMNEINSPYDCIIEEICASNASPVGYDESLFRIREL